MCYAMRVSLRSGSISMIYNRMEEEYNDEWADERVGEVKGSLFERTTMSFTNEVIERNIDQLMERPILNQPIEDYQENGENEEDEMNAEAKETTKETQRQEALFNPVEDEQNEKWIKRHGKKGLKPLNCPSCFNQVAYDYHSAPLDQDKSSMEYCCKQVFGVQVKQNKIIRQASASQTMQWEGFSSPSAQLQLRQREEAINVKILAECSCGYSLGYYDINKDCYVLINVL